MRNPTHPNYRAFLNLRAAAIAAMDRRAWSRGLVRLSVTLRCPSPPGGARMNEYLGGIADSLDGSHGFTFTYLPVAFEDDCQVAQATSSFEPASEPSYVLEIEFLE
ncbi:MAG: hypothetical protein ACHQQS_09180 [Thermoanaerobaculales bacterium]